MRGLRRLAVPALVVGGAADGIAPPANCLAHFELLGSADKELALLGTRFGHGCDYGHGDLVLGTRAHLEVYPLVVSWLKVRATPLGS